MKCFDYHNANSKFCKKCNCRYWIKNKNFKNCTLIGAKSNQNITLENVGEIFNVTRMRICQIEKRAIAKLKSLLNS